jgi:hypothetical protein
MLREVPVSSMPDVDGDLADVTPLLRVATAGFLRRERCFIFTSRIGAEKRDKPPPAMAGCPSMF